MLAYEDNPVSPCRIVGKEVQVDVLYASAFRKVLDHMNPTTLVALQDYNKFLIHIQEQGVLLSYSMDMIARVFMGQSRPQALDATVERISGTDKVVFFRAGVVTNRTVGESMRSFVISAAALIDVDKVLYASTRRLSSKTNFRLLEPVKDVTAHRPSGSLLNFRQISDVCPLVIIVKILTHMLPVLRASGCVRHHFPQ